MHVYMYIHPAIGKCTVVLIAIPHHNNYILRVHAYLGIRSLSCPTIDIGVVNLNIPVWWIVFIAPG